MKLTTKPDHRAAAPGTPAAPIPFHENSKRVQSITVDLSNEGMARQATEPEKAKTHWVEIDEPEIRHRPIGPVVNDEVRIIVAGSRDYHNHANICETLDRIKDRAQAPVRIIDGPYYTGYGRPTGGYKAADSAPPAAPAPAPETAAKPAQAKTGSMMDQMLKKAAYQAPDEDTTRHAWGTNETQANDGPSRFKGGIGAAYLANQWAHMNNVTSTTYRANWEEDRDNARFQRNQRMLDHGRPHLVVAFLSGPEDPLTEHMVQIADKAGVPIEIADERGRTYAYNEARTDQYIPPPPAADDPKLDDPKLGMTVNPKKSQLDKQWFAYGEPKLKDEKSTADHKTAEPSPETVSGSKPSKRTGDTAKTATMDAILKRAYRTPGLMRGKNAPIGGAPPKPPTGNHRL